MFRLGLQRQLIAEQRDVGVTQIRGGFPDGRVQPGVPRVDLQSFFGRQVQPLPVLRELGLLDAAADFHQLHAGHAGAAAVVAVHFLRRPAERLPVDEIVRHEDHRLEDVFDGVIELLAGHRAVGVLPEVFRDLDLIGRHGGSLEMLLGQGPGGSSGVPAFRRDSIVDQRPRDKPDGPAGVPTSVGKLCVRWS